MHGLLKACKRITKCIVPSMLDVLKQHLSIVAWVIAVAPSNPSISKHIGVAVNISFSTQFETTSRGEFNRKILTHL